MNANRRTTYAFTLIEIMIVVSIIGLLAAVAVPSLRRSTDDARRQACILNLKNIEGAKFQWALRERKAGTDTPSDADLFGQGSFISEKPKCPSSGTYGLQAVEEKPTCTIAGHSY